MSKKFVNALRIIVIIILCVFVLLIGILSTIFISGLNGVNYSNKQLEFRGKVYPIVDFLNEQNIEDERIEIKIENFIKKKYKKGSISITIYNNNSQWVLWQHSSNMCYYNKEPSVQDFYKFKKRHNISEWKILYSNTE